MKKNILTSIGLTVFFAVSIVTINVISDSGTTSVYANTGGSPGGRTGSPGDGSSCVACHTSFSLNSGTGTSTITSNIPAAGYVPGQTYTITGSITESGINKFGFEMTAEKDADNSKVGAIVITDATNTKAVGSSAVTHKTAGTAGTGSKSWSFDWTAPSAGAGDVTIYGAFNASNSGSNSSSDRIYTASLSVSEDAPTGLVENNKSINTTIFPNPVKSSFEISTNELINNVVVYDVDGKIMNNVIQNSDMFDATRLASGIYFVEIKTEENLIIKKIVKE